MNRDSEEFKKFKNQLTNKSVELLKNSNSTMYMIEKHIPLEYQITVHAILYIHILKITNKDYLMKKISR